jgi:hypothetical protein
MAASHMYAVRIVCMHVHDDGIEEVVYECVPSGGKNAGDSGIFARKIDASVYSAHQDVNVHYSNRATIFMVRRDSHVTTATPVNGRTQTFADMFPGKFSSNLARDFDYLTEEADAVDFLESESESEDEEDEVVEAALDVRDETRRERGGLDVGLGLGLQVCMCVCPCGICICVCVYYVWVCIHMFLDVRDETRRERGGLDVWVSDLAFRYVCVCIYVYMNTHTHTYT